ncbi:unnamed protein product [Paramecium sonneborni]|uniref:Protein kinase domain-containing protein n=1 Tax=Paramecium sonneborni TaxID=65129 RepID=A0A8S1Q7D6_9CILI|nr:unnamed protein product [Paramecium sonneborni]
MIQQNSLFELISPKEEVYVCHQLIGAGSEGQVYKGIKKDQPSISLAIKFSNDTRNDELQFIYLLLKKQKSENGLKHIICYHDVIENPIFLNNYVSKFKNYCFIMELGEKNLLESVMQSDSYQEKQKIEVIQQIAYGIQELHSLKHYHRDLKPENILKIGNTWKLCDFGFLKHYISQNKTQRVGTPYYIAPEVLLQDQYDYKVDIWSFGCIIYEMITQQIFFFGNSIQEVEQDIKKYAMQQQSNSIIQNIDKRFNLISNPKIQQLCKGMMTVNPLERYDINQVLKELQEILQSYQINQNKLDMNAFQPVKFNQIPFGQNMFQISNTQVLQNNHQFAQNVKNDNKFPNQYIMPINTIQTNPTIQNQNPLFKNLNQNQQINQNCFPNKNFQTQQQFPQPQPTTINNFKNNQQNIDNIDQKNSLKQNEDQQKITVQTQAQEFLSKSLDKIIKQEKKNEILKNFNQIISGMTCDLLNVDDLNDNFKSELMEKIVLELVHYMRKRIDTKLQEESH